MLTPPTEPAILDMSRQGFQAFVMEGGNLELLVAETMEGRLSLSDCYVYDPNASPPPEQLPAGASPGVTGVYSRPEVAAGVPAEPLLFQALPWVERGSGEVFKHKDPINNVSEGEGVTETECWTVDYVLHNNPMSCNRAGEKKG